MYQIFVQQLHLNCPCACTYACGCNATTTDLELMSRVTERHVHACMLRASRIQCRDSAVDVESNCAQSILHHSLFHSLCLQVINVQQDLIAPTIEVENIVSTTHLVEFAAKHVTLLW